MDGATAPNRAAWDTRRPLTSELAVVSAALMYGLTFKIVQDALTDVTPVGFIFIRFVFATMFLLPFAGHRIGRAVREPGARRRTLLVACGAFGITGFLGYTFQNAGLQHTTTSNSAFITGLYVVFAPLVETVAERRRPAANVLLAVAGAVTGLFLLTGANFSLHQGDVYSLLCAFFFGWWIYLGGRYAGFDPLVLAAGQMVVYVVLAAPVVAIQGLGTLTRQAVLACAFTALLGSALAFWLQLWGQQRVEPSRAAVLLMCEPVAAGVVGYLIGERIGVSGYVGAAVIFASMLVAEAEVWRRTSKRGRAESQPDGSASLETSVA